MDEKSKFALIRLMTVVKAVDEEAAIQLGNGSFKSIDTRARTMCEAFLWEGTTQGHCFWSRISDLVDTKLYENWAHSKYDERCG